MIIIPMNIKLKYSLNLVFMVTRKIITVLLTCGSCTCSAATKLISCMIVLIILVNIRRGASNITQ